MRAFKVLVAIVVMLAVAVIVFYGVGVNKGTVNKTVVLKMEKPVENKTLEKDYCEHKYRSKLSKQIIEAFIKKHAVNNKSAINIIKLIELNKTDIGIGEKVRAKVYGTAINETKKE